MLGQAGIKWCSAGSEIAGGSRDSLLSFFSLNATHLQMHGGGHGLLPTLAPGTRPTVGENKLSRALIFLEKDISFNRTCFADKSALEKDGTGKENMKEAKSTPKNALKKAQHARMRGYTNTHQRER